MVKDKEEDLYELENQAAMDRVQEKFPRDDLHLSSGSEHQSLEKKDSNDNVEDNNNRNNDNNIRQDGSTGHGSNDKDDNKHNDNSDNIDDNDNGGFERKRNDSSGNLEKLWNKSKGLSLRRKSAPSAVLFKSLSGNRSKSNNSLWSNAGMGKRDSDHVLSPQTLRVDADASRMFLMEGSAQLATGMQIQERYMFLFSDLLLLAKQKSSTAYKLKHRIQLCDMWIASCIEEVCESTRPQDRSFVLGWPTTNVVVTFPSVEEKERWLHTLVEGITKEKLKDEGVTLPLKVTPKDINSSSKSACQMTVTNETKSEDVLVQCLKQMSLTETDTADYQLWVSCGKDGTPYPLIGHETPFSIKRNQLRELTRSKSRDDIDTMTAEELQSSIMDNCGSGKDKCDFYIKQKKVQKKNNLDDSSYQKKSKKSSNFFSKLASKIKGKSLVFKQPLSECFTENNDPPEAIVKLLVLLYEKGPNFNGIMRRGNNHALGKEIREKIESGATLNLEENQTPTAASVFKDFLRCIPGGLLTTKLESQWMAIRKDDPADVKISKINECMSQMPPQNMRMLTLTICLLQQIAKHKDINRMSPSNLATCIAPSFCPDTNPKQLPGKLNADSLIEVQHSMMAITNIVTPLITFMIVKHVEIFGEDILRAFVPFGCSPSLTLSLNEDDSCKDQLDDSSSNGLLSGDVEDEGDEMFDEDEIHLRRHTPIHPTTRQSNSGTDSDSTHSVLSIADNGGLMRRDDSSIDSLVDRDYYPADSSPSVVKSHLSPSNLSRDSGLTLSDSQLYEEEGDITLTGNNGKSYQRSASHGDDLESNEMGMYDSSMQKRMEPVPPPRSTRVVKKPHDSYANDSVPTSQSYTGSGSHKRAPFVHSASTTALDYLPFSIAKSSSGQNPVAHLSLCNRISSESIGEEEESTPQDKASEFRRMRKGLDMGTIIKSESGTHLFLREELQPSRYNIESGQRLVGKDRYTRQSSISDSTPPVSPQSRYSYSSRESIISDSNYSPSHSAPHTPDSANDKTLSWSATQDRPQKAVDPRLSQSMNVNHLSSLSKSTSNIAKEVEYDDESDDDNGGEQLSDSYHPKNDKWSEKHLRKYQPTSVQAGKGKSHEAEEVEPRVRPNFSLKIPLDEKEFKPKLTTFPIHENHHSLLKGSPPPNVLLKNLQAPHRRESVPEKFNEKLSPRFRRSSADTLNSSFDPTKRTGAFRPTQTASSKPILISSSPSQDPQSSSSRAKLSRYVMSSVDLRPDKPPCYQQTLQRQFMLKQNVPVDIDMDDKQRQKENSYNARAMYEKSLRMYDEQRKNEVESRLPSVKSSIDSSSYVYNSSSFIDTSVAKHNSVIPQSVGSFSQSLDVSHSGGASKDLSGSPEVYDDSGASGFIDLGSISNNLQEDIIKRRNAHPGSGQIIGFKTQNSGSSVSISRTDSKLSDTGSSSGSSATLSTLSQHSDSFSRRSDISSVTVSSTDSSSEANSVVSRRKSGLDLPYSRHFRPVEPDNSDDSEGEEYASSVLQRKPPEKVYQESIKLFEQGHSLPLPDSSSSSATETYDLPSSESSLLPSSYSLTPQSTSNNNSNHPSTESNVYSNILSKPTPQRAGAGNSIKYSQSFQQQRSMDSPKSFRKTSVQPVQNKDSVKTEPQRKFSLTEMQSDEHHSNFLKMRSMFYSPEHESSSPLPSPRVPPHSHYHNHTLLSTSTSTKDISKISQLPQPASGFKISNDNIVIAESSSAIPPSQSSENKELPWNVRKLKMFFDKDDNNTSSEHLISSSPSYSSSSEGHRKSPPPYQNPPSFRRLQDNTRSSISSNSSAGSEPASHNFKSNSSSNRLGPQALSRDTFNSSYSSSEESFNSSQERRSQKSSPQDAEALSDYTNITYV